MIFGNLTVQNGLGYLVHKELIMLVYMEQKEKHHRIIFLVDDLVVLYKLIHSIIFIYLEEMEEVLNVVVFMFVMGG